MSSFPSPVIPVLFPPWASVDHILHRSLIPPEVVPNGPFLGYVTHKNDQVIPLPPESNTNGLDSEFWSDLDQAVLQYLADRPGTWKLEEIELDTGRQVYVLACENDPYACARIIDAEFIQEAHTKLGSSKIIVCIPVQGMMFATPANLLESDLQSFYQLIHKVYSDTQFHPVSPILFLVENCQVIGALSGVDVAAQPVQRQLLVELTKRTLPEGHYAVDILVKKNPPISSRFKEFVQIVENTLRSELTDVYFTGEVTLTINTGGGHRSVDLEVEDDIKRLQLMVDRLVDQKGWITLQGKPVTVNVVHIRPQDNNLPLDKRSTESLIERLLQDDDAFVRARCAEILGQRVEPNAVRALIASLEDEDAEVRQQASDALVQIGDTALIPLEHAADSLSVLLRAQAIATLAKIDPVRYKPLFLEASTDSDVDVRFQAVTALAAIQDADLKDTMFGLLSDSYSPIRACALRWMAGFDTNWSLEGLLVGLRDQDEGIRDEAERLIRAKGRMATEPLKALRRQLDRSRQPELYKTVTGVLKEIDGGGITGIFSKLMAK